MRASAWERDQIRSYFESQWPDDPIVHIEKAASERVGGAMHDIWDVHCADGHWWAVTNPLNAYSQDDFKSREVVLTFHVGLAIRIASRQDVPIKADAATLLPGAWRRWEQAVDALTTAREAEDFQAVGVRLRECLVSFAAEIANEDLVPPGTQPPKRADVVAWTSLPETENWPPCRQTDLKRRRSSRWQATRPGSAAAFVLVAVARPASARTVGSRPYRERAGQ